MTGLLARARQHVGRAHPDLARQRRRDRLGPEHRYPYQEGSFFGNIFVSPPVALLLQRQGLRSRRGARPPGRRPDANAPYTDPFGTPGPLQGLLHGAPATTNGAPTASRRARLHPRRDGVAQLRPQHAVQDLQQQNGKCLEVAGSSTSAGAAIQVSSCTTGRTNQQWTITQIRPASTRSSTCVGKALDSTAARPTTTPRWYSTATRARRRSTGRCSRWATRAMAASTSQPVGKTTSTIWPSGGNNNDGTRRHHDV